MTTPLDDKNLQAVQKSLRDLTTTGSGNGQSMPVDNVPQVGRIAGEGINKFADDLAGFIEKNADEVLVVAKRMQEDSRAFAEQIRKETLIEAERLAMFTGKLQAIGDAVVAARERFVGVEVPKDQQQS